MTESRIISFAASEQLIDALDFDAHDNESTRAARIRAILASYLRSLGLMEKNAPATLQIGLHNPNVSTTGGRT